MVLKNNNNNQCDSDPTALNGAGGDNYQKWKEFLQNIGLYVEKNFPMRGMDGLDGI